jgi:transcription antitermination factor NusG
MKKGDEVRMHDVLKISVGKLAGMAGVVQAIDGENIELAVSGSQDGQQVEVVQVFNVKALRRIHG